MILPCWESKKIVFFCEIQMQTYVWILLLYINSSGVREFHYHLQ